jgi:hypothetical protein
MRDESEVQLRRSVRHRRENNEMLPAFMECVPTM